MAPLAAPLPHSSTLAPNDNARAALRTLRPLAGYLRSTGQDAMQLFVDMGINPSELLDSSASIPHPLMLDVWRQAEKRCNDPSLGLHVLERLELRMLERAPLETEWLVLQMFVISPTLDEALSRFARYLPVTFYGSAIVVDRDHHFVHIRHRVLGTSSVPRSFAEFIVGLMARLIHDITSQPVKPQEIRFAHAGPVSFEEVERILPVTPRYSAGENAISLNIRDLDVPMRSPNATLLSELDRRAAELLARLPPLESYVDQVRALIAAELVGGNPNADHIADALQISVRTLSRRLHAFGTSHKALLDEVRASLARHYLLDDRRSVNEVARLIGFSEVSAFHRAFRRWYGQSPTGFCRNPPSSTRDVEAPPDT